MAHILTRKYGSGSLRYTAVVRIRQGTQVIHREAKTFSHRAAAERWAKAREVALEDPSSQFRQSNKPRTLASLIRWYIESFGSVSRWQRSKQAHLQFLERHAIGKQNALALTASQLVKHIQSRRSEGAGPATAGNDLVWIGVVLRAAKSVDGISVNPRIVDEARDACNALRLIGKARRRDRRPSADELARLEEFFSRRDERSSIPMVDIMRFAIASARRQSEICRIGWADNDAATRTGIVRDAKHPTAKTGNHRRFKYTPEAWEIVSSQPRLGAHIFPYNEKSVGAAFTRACKVLGIQDLRFHDLRHEATSRLFERGYQIHEVAQFTLHDSWSELKRYANLRPEQLRDIPAPPSASDAANDPEISRTKVLSAATTAAKRPARADGR
jgi:integrase